MRRRSEPPERQTYLAEHYRPGLEPADLGRLATHVRKSVAKLAREGRAVRFLRSTIVPRDECCLLVLEAASEELVGEVYARAGVPIERRAQHRPPGLPAARDVCMGRAPGPRRSLRRPTVSDRSKAAGSPVVPVQYHACHHFDFTH